MQQEKLITIEESRKYETICRVLKKEITQKNNKQYFEFDSTLNKKFNKISIS